jgi:predicted DNA-binding transcriptional regulator AlpA
MLTDRLANHRPAAGAIPAPASSVALAGEAPATLVAVLADLAAALRDAARPGLANDPDRLIDIGQLGKLLSLSRPTLERMKAAGQLPRHLVLSGNAHRWKLSEIRAWILAGAPPLAEWERLQRR